MKLTFKSFKYTMSLIGDIIKDTIHRWIFLFVIIVGVADFLVKESTLTGGLAFMGFIVFAGMLNVMHLRRELKDLNDNWGKIK